MKCSCISCKNNVRGECFEDIRVNKNAECLLFEKVYD